MLEKLFRSLPHFKGKNRLLRFVLQNKINSVVDIELKGDFDCLYRVPNIKESIGFELFSNGVYELETIELIVKLLPPNGVFLDLGSNIGAILVPVSKLRKDIRIIGVEAAPWIFEYLEANIRLNSLTNTLVINKALFTEDGLLLDFFSPTEKYGKGSLSPVFTSAAVKVPTITVDTIISENNLDKVDVIKLDVEGFEYFVFKGGSKLLSRPDAPHILFEFVDWAENAANGCKAGDAQKLLLEFGYTIYSSENGKMSRLSTIMERGFANLLAIKSTAGSI